MCNIEFHSIGKLVISSGMIVQIEACDNHEIQLETFYESLQIQNEIFCFSDFSLLVCITFQNWRGAQPAKIIWLFSNFQISLRKVGWVLRYISFEKHRSFVVFSKVALRETSLSISAMTSIPATFNPRVNPPTPEKKSTARNFFSFPYR